MSRNTIVNQRFTGLLLLGLGLSVAPHLPRLPPWISGLVGVLFLWRYLACSRGWAVPGRGPRLAFAAAAMAGIYLSFGSLTGRDAGVALLVVMLSAKLLEVKQRRDVVVLMFVAYFVVVTQFLYSQSVAATAYALFAVWCLLTLHLCAGHSAWRPLAQSVRLAGVLMAQALPLMVVLFVLFPRIPGPLWTLPKDAHGGLTGLSDSMSPGAISQLSQSDAVAFRVQFDGPPPPPEQRYWRGPVLWDTDGRRWFAGSPGRAVTVQVAPPQRALHYTVTLEPHNRKWLLALDWPVEVPLDARLSDDFQVLAARPVQQRRRYHLASYLAPASAPLSPAQRRRALALPQGGNPRSVALGRELRRRLRDDRAIVARVLQRFRTEDFVYTLSPPLLAGEHVTDAFLFDSRRGFCEHFAASFVVVMRAAGIPARIVTGYLGGERNPLNGYLVVRQRDAHAWAEVWLNGRWRRVDPTTAVAPERIERSIQVADLGVGAAVLFEVPGDGVLGDALRRLRYALDAFDNGWNQWVLGYGPELQEKFLDRWGVDARSWSDVAGSLLAAGGLLIAAVAFYMMRPTPQTLDPVQRAYLRFCRKLARCGLKRAEHEAPADFAQRVSRARPDLAATVACITRLYSQLRYSTETTPGKTAELKKRVARFRP
ncbi:MAG TPA: DUF3488 domain-containing protein [Gammaproteobacteria bacterium]|nr:DUF3488 domain-containing protein [Gammaproteobacteria bacterium]